MKRAMEAGGTERAASPRSTSPAIAAPGLGLRGSGMAEREMGREMTEQGVLRASILVTVGVASLGILFGLLSGSYAITFDGMYALADAGMSGVALVVARLIAAHAAETPGTDRLRERFSMGVWHLEPMVLALNGTLLIGVSVYALVNAVGSLLSGGRPLEFGWAVAYAIVVAAVCAAMALVEARANRRIRSALVGLDVRSWTMSGGITLALLVAFALGLATEGTDWAWIGPYVDPAALALVCLVIIPMPVSIVRRALADILLVTPPALMAQIDAVAREVVARHGLAAHKAYAARVGRARLIELYFIVPPGGPARPIEYWDAIRDEIGGMIGGAEADRWLTIVFTGDREWAE